MYQWRLRRKLEEAKKANPEATLQLPIITSEIKILPSMAETNFEKVSHESVKLACENKIEISNSIQTQTCNLKDSEAQTNIDSSLEVASSNICTKKAKKLVSNDAKKVSKLKHEIPTKDEENKVKDKKLVKKDKQNEIKTAKFTSSSPIKKNEKLRYFSDNTNSSAELTKVSFINEKTPLTSSNNFPRKSTSPVNFKPALERQSTTSSITSTISSICSSITNITARTSPIHMKKSSIQVVATGSKAQSIDFDKTITIESVEDSKLARKNDKINIYLQNGNQNSNNELNLNDSNYDSNDEYENHIYESDEILQILFKKTYFYQLKLK